uniref:Ketosynthase family 3 (KS3) domain-containing protein n=1 Tax=Alexandrium monilatum TaxID=311494 RepID=A0A7S4PZ26_9DINO
MALRLPDGVDFIVGQHSDEAYAGVLVSCLASKGFCVIDLALGGDDAELLGRARTEAEALRAAGCFARPPALIADGLLGPEGSAGIAELEAAAVGADCALGEVDAMISSVGVTLGPHTARLGVEVSHRSNALLHEAGIPDDGPPLTERDITKWLEKFLRHTVMVIVFLGPMDGVLTLKVFEEQEAEAYEVKTEPGTMVVLRPDMLSHEHVALGRALAVSSFFIDAHTFRKRHPTGGWVMCPAARELDRWAMERVRTLKARVEDEADWDPAIPREFQRAMNLTYFKGNMVGVRAVSCKYSGAYDYDIHFRSYTGGTDYVTRIPFSRWDHSPYFDESPEGWRSNKTYSRHGAFIEGVELFDAKTFSLSTAESRSMDPHQRHILEVGYDALVRMGMRRAGLMNSSGSVYVGHAFGEYSFAEKSGEGMSGPTGGAGCVAANRLSFVLGMKGPSMAMDTDQSSSMTAVFMTSESVQRKGRGAISDFGLGIGAQLMMSPVWWPQHCAMGWLSIRGRCLTYDASASGFARGEGVGAVALKPLADVVNGEYVRDDTSPLVGVLAGTCLNINGRGASLGAPSGMAEQEVIAESVRNAGIASQDVDAVEAHGSGAPLSDVIEVGSLTRGHRYKDHTPLAVTSVKTMVGNLMECGGISSLMKNLLGVQWGFTACGLHLRELNPHMDIDDGSAMLLSEHLTFPRKNAFAGVMSRGYGGTNVYSISWGTLDEEKVAAAPAIPAFYQRVHFWPGGGGFLDAKDRPDKAYCIVGSWMEWSNPQPMEEEGSGVFGYTVTLGENGWEQFQVLLDGDAERVLHPGGARVGKETPVYGPESGILGASTWMIDGRCGWVEVPAPREGTDPAGDGQAAEYRVVPVEALDAGRPGDRYRVKLRVAGKWRVVTWDKEEQAAALDNPRPARCVGKYYIVSSWNRWDYEELQPDPSINGLYRIEVSLHWGMGDFQIVRNRDLQQVLHPAGACAPADGDVLGPDEDGEGLHWRIQGSAGDSFRIEFQRTLADGEDVKRVSWQRIEQ